MTSHYSSRRVFSLILGGRLQGARCLQAGGDLGDDPEPLVNGTNRRPQLRQLAREHETAHLLRSPKNARRRLTRLAPRRARQGQARNRRQPPPGNGARRLNPYRAAQVTPGFQSA
jgi:hypothetical protein